jgi:hypothetical protein
MSQKLAHLGITPMNASLLRALHPPAQRGQLAHTQGSAKVQNQFPHHRETGTLLFESVHNSACSGVKSVRNLLNAGAKVKDT